MIDFIEYVVAELKSRRLSKASAVALVQQFARRSPASTRPAVLHPLLHCNTSDLTEQRYSTTLTGQEFYLLDHQVRASDGAMHKVLPGVAYLEMARAAIEQASPERMASTMLELHNVVWAQPIVVDETKKVCIALLPGGDDRVDFEIYSPAGDDDFVHGQGRAVVSRESGPVALDLRRLEEAMQEGEFAPDAVYAACAGMGLLYGPSFQTITAIRRGNGQALARLRLPDAIANGATDYVLHPSLLDGALQAAVALMESGAALTQPRLPFALERLRIVAPCTTDMVAWVRFASGSHAGDKVVKLDLALCDEHGNVCVEMRGLSWRVLSGEISFTAKEQRALGTLLATPVWQAGDGEAATVAVVDHHIVLCDLPLAPPEGWVSLQSKPERTAAQRYTDHAMACFERVQAILQSRRPGKVLLQIVVADELLAGLSGLLKTAALENPQFIGQLIVVSGRVTAEELGRRLEDERRRGLDAVVRYERGRRTVLRWQEVPVDRHAPPIAFVERGVYLITGALGGLGLLFAREILAQASEARVVLTGRSPGNAETEAIMGGLSAQGRASYRQVDLGDGDDVQRLVDSIREEHERLDGILHCAGMIADRFILQKSAAEFSAVLTPKVAGTFHLDEATREVPLDFFVLFSAIAGTMGNAGQADYATANAFMDQFAAHRNRQVAAQQRHGRTRAIDWPLWNAGGMTVDRASRQRLQQTTGMHPMQTATGIDAFHRIVAMAHDQLLVVEGDLARIRRTLLSAPVIQAEPEPAPITAEFDAGTLAEKTQQYLRRQFSGILKVPTQKIDVRAALENYGIDSILAMQLTNQLETTFGSLPKTLFFEYQTIRDLAEYFVAQHAVQLTALFAPAAARMVDAAPVLEAVVPGVPSGAASTRRASRRRSAAPPSTQDDELIAIIGLSGRYPEAVDLEAYWTNLQQGKDCITEVPDDRWNWQEYFSEDRTKSGHHYSKWGGFISGVDEFDPLFFNIPPVEAETIDPQERLFLQHAWMAVEDAGYSRASLQLPSEDDLPGQVGVYVGVMYTEYQLFGAEAAASGRRVGIPGSAASVANRVSYALNLHGPSMTLDTMCSSSLTAIHIACQDLKQKRTGLAIAGGVNVTIHPNKYLILSEGQFISSDGHCQSFGEGGDGYIPGEGVGVVILKRLSDAERDGDHIYGVIRGSALTHGGKTNGYSVPNPQAQGSAIRRALAEARTDARHISYLEAHGTGTKLGDPIEIAALSKAFGKDTPDTEYCLIGSAKSNVGHCESAAGIAGLTKVLLQMQHRQIVPSLHSAQLNPHIDFGKSPFVVNQTLQAWDPPVLDGRTLPRIAGVSSFGAGGSNAHMIVEEYQRPVAEPVAEPVATAPVLIVLSARTATQLQQKASELLDFVGRRQSPIDLASIAYTLQVGREPMEERLAFVAGSLEELVETLQSCVVGQQGVEGVHRGQARRSNETVALFSTDGDLQQAIDRWIAGRKLSHLLDLWVQGLDFDWNKLHGEVRPRRMSLPTYPFARDRYWIDFGARKTAGAAAVLHPLLHSNTSDLTGQRYRSTFTGHEFFLADHQVGPAGQAAQKVLPGVAYLEMARAAIEQAAPARGEATVLELHDTVWTRPIVVTGPTEISVALGADDHGRIAFEIYSEDAEEEVVHCQGSAVFSHPAAPAVIDLARLQSELVQGAIPPDILYATCARMGLLYGPSFRGIESIQKGHDQVLARLRLPNAVTGARDYLLHPTLMDGALQAAVGLLEDGSASSQPRLPFALDTLLVIAPCPAEMFAWVRYSGSSRATDAVVRLDIDLCDPTGSVCVQMRGLSSRMLNHALGVAATPRAELPAEPQQPPAPALGPGSLAEDTQEYLRRQLAGVLKLPAHNIDPHAALEEYGIDSVLAMKLTSQLEKTFGALPKTLFFEYQTIQALAEHFAVQYEAQVTELLRPANHSAPLVAPPVVSPAGQRLPGRRLRRPPSSAGGATADASPIAIIGLAGRYPEAVDVEAYWRNLRDGKDCITEVPRSRWEWREYFSDDRTQTGRHYSKWGGFISGIDEFDPLFFNISPVDAERIDPQERLFLQHAWMAVEDAGYTRASLQVPQAGDLHGQVGVYVGVMYNEYQLFAAEANARGKRLPIPGSTASIANRVSYALNLHGPSVTLDTMCSSSLTAIHFACQDLKLGRTTLAIAGGVNVSIHPNKYLVLSTGQFISSDGHCQSFGEGGDGYIPGEGVGAVILKRLSEATRDGDHIYGVIRGSALNHGGKTNGYTVPSPQAQASAITRALAESAIDPRRISYIEAHGTGTTLGDPIEIAALSKSFGQQTGDTAFCFIGSAKSNIGHCESAAGIAGLTKVLLQLQHQQIVPSLHSAQLNPHIDFASTPFIVNQALRPWDLPVIEGRNTSRVAGISSFGAGGSNAHLVVEEYRPPVREAVAVSTVAILLSARTPEQLRQKALDLAEFVQARVETIDLTATAYTLQVGREAMEERLGFVATSLTELLQKLAAYLAGGQASEIHEGQVRRGNEALSAFSTDVDLQQTVERWIAGRKLSKLLELWVKGLELDWSKLYGETTRPPRIALPVYPFAKERYWVDVGMAPAAPQRGATAVLHPLLHANTSDLNEQRYRSTFTGQEFFLADHQVKPDGRTASRILPGVAHLEMVRAAIEQALPDRPADAVLGLRNVIWAQPIVVNEARQIHIALTPIGNTQIDYEIYSEHAGEEFVHGQGRATLDQEPAPDRIDLERLESRMCAGAFEPRSVYAALERMGLIYGPAFQSITAIRRGEGEALARLRLPSCVGPTADDYVLHPSLMDGALQAAVGLLDDLSSLSRDPLLPFALESLRVVARCTPSMVAWVRSSAGSRIGDPVVKTDIDLCDERGNVCVQMRGFASRTVLVPLPISSVATKTTGVLYAAPVWQETAIAATGRAAFSEQHVVLCAPGLEALGSLLPRNQCVHLRADQESTIAQRYTDAATACFERIKSILQSKPAGEVLLQIVVADEGEQSLMVGLSGLLKTAAAENPRFTGQLIIVPAHERAEDLARRLEEETRARDQMVRYRDGVREVLRWQEVATEPSTPPIAFKENGVYLITGGLGGLGLLFAKEIVERTRDAHVVLTGRAAWSEAKSASLEGLAANLARVSYRQLDLGNAEQVRNVVRDILDEHGRLDGILHSAGMTADRFILRKSGAELVEVLAPKVTGTFHLDQATRDIELDCFVLFSSVAGVMGNPGQADYATANAFLDRFAAHRNELVAAQQRHGRTRSIDWPLWQAGGMRIDADTQEALRQNAGMYPMQTAAGLRAFHQCLALAHDQMLVVEGDVAQIRRTLLGDGDLKVVTHEEQAVTNDMLTEKTQDYLRHEFADLLKLPFQKIDPHAALEQYGIDSILAMRLTNHLEKTFGSLSKTLFFEYQTIAALAGYLLKAHADSVRGQLGLNDTPKELVATPTVAPLHPVPVRRRGSRFLTAGAPARHEIAIVGLAGRYPQADNLAEFWRNLQNGRDCITEVPADRWDHTLYFDPDPNKAGKSYSKWGGFIADVDKFDPLFFNISPKEAELIDPQERLFLETAWETIEDAGYTKESISGRRVGVFVGVMWGQYQLFGAESLLSANPVLPGSSHGSIANRVSYYFDLHGPSIALDTMCSSSLTAIHLACEALRRGEIEAALAGGVNLTVHPYKYLGLSQGKFAASDGRCRSFGAGGDGYVPGEGVGAILLKPLEHALRDGDQVYAVIRSSAINHGGKTNGYTVPNPIAQGELIRDALRDANIDPNTLSYIETHGTGTSLGDPIEIAGLSKAFEESTYEKQFCPIGSVKSNIGHLESAAGIAAVTKALLQLRHQQLVPSLHAELLNPYINFADSPFHVQTKLADWVRPSAHPRRVGVSSFGAGGSNAHLILEEHDAHEDAAGNAASAPAAFVLSARTPAALRRYAERVARFLENAPAVSLASVAHTSQVGRTPMDVRLAVIASSVSDLGTKLNAFLNGVESEAVFHRDLREVEHGAASLIAGPAGKVFVDALLSSRELEKVARLWVEGVDVDWSVLYRQGRPRRVSLPTYPFEKERCWIQQAPSASVAPKRALHSAAIQQPAIEQKRRTWYAPQWSPHPLMTPGGTRPWCGPVLILGPSEELWEAMLAQSSGPDSLVQVQFGMAFEELAPNRYVLDQKREEQFNVLLDVLHTRALFPGAILHCAPQEADLDSPTEVARHLEGGVYRLFDLCRALMRRRHQEPVRIVSVFDGGPEAADPLGAAIAGFLKTLTLEDPRYQTKAVETDRALAVAEKAALLWDELSERDWAVQEIRYRGVDRSENLTRSVRTLAARVDRHTDTSSLPLRQEGVYLITGGLGALGRVFAEYLAKNYRARLVLSSRTAPSATQQKWIDQLKAYGAKVLVLQADVAQRQDVDRVVTEAKAHFAAVHGVIHAAGVNRDALLLRKTREEMDAVLGPKIHGTINVDLATRAEGLDFFVLFSSIAGVTGNAGQCDYAYGNRFLDAFAERRDVLRGAQQRSGRTVSFDWPLWEEGGMRIAADAVAHLESQTGMCPLPTGEGLRYFEDILRGDGVQEIALYGVASRIATFIESQATNTRPLPVRVEALDLAALSGRTETYLKALIGEEIKLAPERIGLTDRLESLGIDSVMIHHINAQLERDLGALPKTLLYEHETVRELALHLVSTAREALVKRFGPAAPDEPELSFTSEETPPRPVDATPALYRAETEPIAIVGMHGYYPHSATLASYWENLRQGRDLIDLVPPDRWDYQEFYHPDPAAASAGKIYCKWGGFLTDHDKFDPHFFKISTAEAKVLDPQERLFLESVWTAIEDAGYTRDRLRARFPRAGSANVGVFVGVTTNSYDLLGPEERTRGNFLSPTSLPWSIANRVSYFFDFNGPSLPVDTACSSSLVAVHLACESLRSGASQMAIAGGVNLYSHPAKYQSLCQRRMVSRDGKCHSYGAGGDGFVPGEGVGTLVLRPLSKAIEDHDRIYAVIRGSAYDHSGRSNGYSAPNPNAQANLISDTLTKAGIHPDTIGYVEGHGTGTQLGDSIEIAALTKAFQRKTTRTQFCPIGSVKANIGHSESAAGIAGLAKVVLQMQHGQLAPSIHSDEPNPNIEFQKSPFYLQHELAEWPVSPDHPRRALVNSFGAGGVNACVVLEQYQAPVSTEVRNDAEPYLFVLSARNEERLRDYAQRLLTVLHDDEPIDLGVLCYTLQSGREAMEERLAIVASDAAQLLERLGDWTRRGSASDVHRGSLAPRRGSKRSLKLVRAGSGEQSLVDLALRWVAGEDVEWESLYGGTPPRRAGAPTYPFARERYWVSDSVVQERAGVTIAHLHPLIAYNSSTLKEVNFSSALSDTAFYAVDHRVHEERIFPGAAFLEMACIAGTMASEQRVRKLKDIVWIQPLSFRSGVQTLRTAIKRTDHGVEYVISSLDDDNELIVHSEGRLVFETDDAEANDRTPPSLLKAGCLNAEDRASYYERLGSVGLHYGPSFQTIQNLHVNHTAALAKLRIADHLRAEFGQFMLHPSLIDGALQTIATLAGEAARSTPYLPFALDELEILGPVPQTCYAYAERADTHAQNHAGVMKFNIRLLNESGETLVKFKNLYVRPLATPLTAGHAQAAAQPASKGRLISLSGGAIE